MALDPTADVMIAAAVEELTADMRDRLDFEDVPCDGCERSLALSVVGCEAMEREGLVQVACLPCAQALRGPGESHSVVPPEVREAVAKVYGKEKTDELADRIESQPIHEQVTLDDHS